MALANLDAPIACPCILGDFQINWMRWFFYSSARSSKCITTFLISRPAVGGASSSVVSILFVVTGVPTSVSVWNLCNRHQHVLKYSPASIFIQCFIELLGRFSFKIFLNVVAGRGVSKAYPTSPFQPINSCINEGMQWHFTPHFLALISTQNISQNPLLFAFDVLKS